MAYLVKINQVNRRFTIKRIERKIVIKRSGQRGLPGANGVGVPTGGTTGQILTKISDTDYATDWEDAAAGGVSSVNGYTGDVVLAKGDLDLGNVDNTSDADKPVSDATQTALDAKVDIVDAYNDGDLYVRFGAGTSGLSKADLAADTAFASVYERLANKGQALGYASLDNGGKVPVSQLPASVMTYLGTWNASTNTPTLANGTGDAGDLYICSVAGTTNFGAGNLTFDVGDWVMYNGSIWQRSDQSDNVSSVFGRQGAVTATAGDYTASQVTNVAAGNIAAVTVQAAIDELDTEKVAKAGDTMTGILSIQTGGAITPATQSTYALTVRNSVLTTQSISLGSDNNFAYIQSFGSVPLLLNRQGNNVTIGSSAGSGFMGLYTTSPTHSITLASLATGIALYNTVDQTTNYERVRLAWTSNIFNMLSENGGTGTARQIDIKTSAGNTLSVTAGQPTAGIVNISRTTLSSGTSGLFGVSSSFTASSGSQFGIQINPTITQTGTASYVALLVNPTHSTIGSGTTSLADFQVGGVSKFRVSAVNGWVKRVTAITSSATPTVNTDNADKVDITALATAITSMTSGLTGTPTNGQALVFEIKDNGTPQTIAWGSAFVAGGVALPTTTVASKILTVGFMYSTANGLNKWRCIASVQEA
jgi:hypothetical protein